MERFTDKDIAKKINTGYYGDSCNSFEIYTRCAEFEDLMEEFGFESVESLKQFTRQKLDTLQTKKDMLDWKGKAWRTLSKLKSYEQMWDELRKYIKEMREGDLSFHDEEHNLFVVVENVIINKMQELEKSAE